MRRSRIYCDTALDIHQSLVLDARNSHYLLHVLRVKEAQVLTLFDGKGSDYKAVIDQVLRKSVHVTITEKCSSDQVAAESPLRTTLAIAISKGERMDWVMQKATELGVTAIQPLITERVDVKLNEQRMAKKTEHWRGIVIAACEQSGRSVLPILAEPTPIKQWLTNHSCAIGLVLRAHGETFLSIANAMMVAPDSATVLIGPEGGLSEAELQQAEQAGFIATGLGPRILRTETAPVAALTLLQTQWGDF